MATRKSIRGKWKGHERQHARFFHTERTPLSGGSSRHTRSDSLHPILYEETKTVQKGEWIEKVWRDTVIKAKKEGKIPLLCLRIHGVQGFLIVTNNKSIDKIIDCRVSFPSDEEIAEFKTGLTLERE